MIDLKAVNKIYLANGYTDLRAGIDGYISIVEGSLKLSVYDRSLFIFCNKQRNKIKILHYEDGCFWLYYKRMEHQRIRWPRGGISTQITKDQIGMLLKGYVIESAHRKW
ncbi:MAG: IS66 family insertion sequence element accessory protein TnpB [Bacilli bacterium]|nr:IS66 family insertion sequence element accessory protein TnpB [Bacilli bacterium]